MDAAHDLVTEEEYYDVETEEKYFQDYGQVTTLKIYNGNKNIRFVKIPDSVTVLNYSNFERCSNLERVEMGKKLTHIEVNAFSQCTNLKTIVWSTSLEYIEIGAFRYTGIETLKVPEGVKKLGQAAFEGCTELRSAYIPDTVEEMGFLVFKGCSKLHSVRLPRNKNCTELQFGFFKWCDSLVSLDIPENFHTISKSSLLNESLLAVAFHAPNITLSSYVDGNHNLKIIVYPDTEHNNRAFEREMQHMPNVKLIGLIQPTGKVNWHNRTGPLVSGLTDSDIASAGLTKSDIASLFPEKKAALREVMLNLKRIDGSMSGPPLSEIQRTIFPEVFAVEDFIRRYGGYRRVVNALRPAAWLD